MRKINTFITENNQLNQLNNGALSRALADNLWQISAPKLLSQSSHAIGLNHGELKVVTNSAIIANKIKLTQEELLCSLLTQLQNLKKKEPSLRECKVTSISVKVQVKSMPKPVLKAPRIISTKAAMYLKSLALNLGETPLAQKLNALANKR